MRPIQVVSIVAVAALWFLFGCSPGGSSSRSDAGPADRRSGSGGHGPITGTGGIVGDAGPDAEPVLPADLAAPPPPEIACADGGDDACPLPPSVCAVPGDCDAAAASCSPPTWVVYYDQARCVDGRCVWTERYMSCHGYHSLCQAGGCLPASTLPG